MVPPAEKRCRWDRLCGVALGQQGYFTAAQAEEAGYSPQLLRHHLLHRRFVRVRRAIYRIHPFPRSAEDELVVRWLWSGRVGVLSHQTALALHGLSDAPPPSVHLTVPASWARRRLRVPPGTALHAGTVPASDRVWAGPVPTTSPLRTLLDCAWAGVGFGLLLVARQRAKARGVI